MDTTYLPVRCAGKLLETFKGHTDRLARLAFHPRLPGMMATASFDHTWRLWDVATATEVLLQEGHSRPVYGASRRAVENLSTNTLDLSPITIWAG